MGLMFLELEIGNPANPAVTERLDFLIDSGAIYSVVPNAVLERLGIQPLATQEFRLANGTKVQRKKGMAVFKYGDRIGGADAARGLSKVGQKQEQGLLKMGELASVKLVRRTGW